MGQTRTSSNIRHNCRLEEGKYKWAWKWSGNNSAMGNLTRCGLVGWADAAAGSLVVSTLSAM